MARELTSDFSVNVQEIGLAFEEAAALSLKFFNGPPYNSDNLLDDSKYINAIYDSHHRLVLGEEDPTGEVLLDAIQILSGRFINLHQNVSAHVTSGLFEQDVGRSAMLAIEEALSSVDQLATTLARDAPPNTFGNPPPQLPGPVEFGILGGKLVVVEKRSAPSDLTAQSASHALAMLQRQANRLLEEFSASNLDRRFVADLRELIDELSTGNAIRVGVAHLAFTKVSEFYTDEMPVPIMAMVEAFSQATTNYLNQFDDWLEFISQATLPVFTSQMVGDLIAASKVLVATLSDATSVADPRVPLSIKWVSDTVESVKGPSARITFALEPQGLCSLLLRDALVDPVRAKQQHRGDQGQEDSQAADKAEPRAGHSGTRR